MRKTNVIQAEIDEIRAEMRGFAADIEAGRIKDEAYAVKRVGKASHSLGALEQELKEAETLWKNVAKYSGAAEVGYDGGEPVAASTKAFNGDDGWLLSQGQQKQLNQAFQAKQPLTLEVDWTSKKGIQTKAAASNSGLTNGPLPGIIQPNLFMSLPYEPTRIASYLPAAAMDGPSAVWLDHSSNTGSTSGVAELGTKPDLGPTFTEVKVLPQKLAGQASITMELNQDYPQAGGWIQTELQRDLINQENEYLLNANGSGGPSGAVFNGLLATSGTLTRDATGTNGLDAIALAAMDIRSSSQAYGPADLLILHPQTVTALMMTKDDQGRYLLDMLQGPAGSLTWNGDAAAQATTNPSLGGIWPQGHEGGNLTLFGCPVVQTTQCPAGTGVMLSVRSGAAVYWVRLSMLIIFDPYTGLSQNTYRWVAESRISLSTPRPGAINIISNLPVA